MNTIYTPPEAAAEILQERLQDEALKMRVGEYLGGIFPFDTTEQQKPIAILARYVPRATSEDKIFAERALDAGLEPYWASYRSDRFTTRNPEKVETVRPPIAWAKGQKTRSWIVAPEKRYGGVGNLETIYGNTSYDYQQNMRKIVLPRLDSEQLVSNTFDMGGWYRLQAERFGYSGGNSAPYYYVATMALTTTFCALYEDFDGGPNASNGDLEDFKSSVVCPAFERVERDLGLRPIIVKLPYEEGMNITDLSFLGADDAEQLKKFGSLAKQSVTVEAIDE